MVLVLFNNVIYVFLDCLCGLVVRVSGYGYRGPGFDPRRYHIFWVVVGLERGLLSLVRSIEELLEQKSSGSRSRKQRLTAVGTRCADRVTPLYPQKLALTSPTGGGHSVGIVRSWTKDTEFSLVYVFLLLWLCILILCLCMATFTEVLPCFFLSCKANARINYAKTRHSPHSSKFLCCSMCFVLLYVHVLFVLCCSVYYLCVYVYCTTATGWLPICS
jgi:hypothetical protein